MLSALDLRIIDANLEAAGSDTEILMDNAGKAVASLVKSLNPGRVLIACGSGNNAGDGYAAGIYLQGMGIKVDAYPLSPPSTKLCRKKHDQFVRLGGEIVESFLKEKYDVIVDALLGIGISGSPREPFLSPNNILNIESNYSRENGFV